MTDFSEAFKNDLNVIQENDSMLSKDIYESDARVYIDVQVATSRKYPRDLPKVLKNILFLATQDKETAENCFYSIIRDGKTIRGASIRLAEIIATCYGNVRASASIVSNDGKIVTARGMCWDMENNVAYSIDVMRKITDKQGRTFSEDMQVVTSNACCSIALRNAIFKVIPVAITSKIQSEIKNIIVGQSKDFETNRNIAIDYFVNLGITVKSILTLLNKKVVEDLTPDDIFDLRGLATAIKEGDTTLELAFSLTPKNNTTGKAINTLSKVMESIDNNETTTESIEPSIDYSKIKKPTDVFETAQVITDSEKKETKSPDVIEPVKNEVKEETTSLINGGTIDSKDNTTVDTNPNHIDGKKPRKPRATKAEMEARKSAEAASLLLEVPAISEPISDSKEEANHDANYDAVIAGSDSKVSGEITGHMNTVITDSKYTGFEIEPLPNDTTKNEANANRITGGDGQVFN